MKSNILLPTVFVVVFAVSRIPGLMPPDFSVAYAFAFCSGVFLAGRLAWWLPLVTMLVTDVALNIFYYHVAPFGLYMVLNYAVYALLIALGRWFGRKAPFLKLLFGGILGAALFYLVTNTLSWLQNPAYAKTLAGWIIALTKGTGGYPSTWEFFRNTLMSGALFTALFAAAGKLTAESPADKTAGAHEPSAGEEPQAETEPEEAKA